MKKRNLFAMLGLSTLALAGVGTLASCGSKTETFMIWGPEEHRDMYTQLGEEFKAANPDFPGTFEYAASGDAGAYSNMSIDPQAGATVFTFANDMLNNLNRLGALAPLLGDNLTFAKTKNNSASFEAGKIGDKYYAYPVQADNGYYMYFRKDVFKDTSVWDSATGTLKDGYTFRDLYKAIDEKAASDTTVKDAKVTWAIGDAWYVSGAFFAVGGNYNVTYDEAGTQTDAKCWFAYDKDVDATGATCINGLNATYGIINSVTNAAASGRKGSGVNTHFMFSDGDKTPLNDNITKYSPTDSTKNNGTPLVAAVCGTWKAKELMKNWGDNYAATYLPKLECYDGDYQWKNFCGFKLMGVNPLSSFASKDEAHLAWAHKVAQFMTDKESQLLRYQATGAGPSNLEALQDDTIKADVALKALNAQYDYKCVYPTSTTVVDKTGASMAGKNIDNGLGYRIQDSVPANYWTPLASFGNNIYNELKSGTLDKIRTDGNIKRTTIQLQADIQAAAV
jgi:arabinogalactan oligomer/maltooligosaccharide transport system substrate-binding protein